MTQPTIEELTRAHDTAASLRRIGQLIKKFHTRRDQDRPGEFVRLIEAIEEETKKCES